MTELRKKNRISLIILLVGLILTVAIASMPLYTFQAGVYTKKSPNTFVGDATYNEVKAEVEKVAEEYRAQGLEVEIQEEVTERTTSKGEKTSLVAFTIAQTQGKSLWSFIGTGLVAGYIFLAIIILAVLALISAFVGTTGSWNTLNKDLDPRSKFLRGLSVVASVLAFLLVPVITMANNLTFSRRLGLYLNGQLEEGKDKYFASMDKFFFDGTAGDSIESMLGKVDVHQSGMLYFMLLTLGIMIIAAIMIRHGALKNTLLRMLLYVFVIIVSLVTIYPYFVMLVTGLRSNAETLDMHFLHILPTKWMWQNLVDILNRGVARYLLNSLIVAGGATIIAMLCGVPAAYALARMNFKGKNVFLGFVIVSQMFSPVVLLIGISQLMNTLHLNNSLLGLMLINAAFNQAFAVWLLRGTFVAISPEMEEASMIDGCGTVSALTKVLVPMAAPGIVTALIFVFINAWNEYTISTVLISTAEYRPITVGITQFSSFNMIEWQYLFAASLLATIPVVILFMSIEKHLTAGLTSGGVKG